MKIREIVLWAIVFVIIVYLVHLTFEINEIQDQLHNLDNNLREYFRHLEADIDTLWDRVFGP